jgi:nucleotide-binding universal stress UspA family protein
MLPAIISQCVVALKDTALGFIIGAPGIVRDAERIYIAPQYNNPLAVGIVLAAIFIVINYSLSRLAIWLESRLRREGRDAPDDLQWMINPAEDVDATLRECEERAEERGLRWASEARQGDPAKILVELAAGNDADVLVIGNKGMERKVLGSVPNSVSHHAPCSVLIVKTT